MNTVFLVAFGTNKVIPLAMRDRDYDQGQLLEFASKVCDFVYLMGIVAVVILSLVLGKEAYGTFSVLILALVKSSPWNQKLDQKIFLPLVILLLASGHPTLAAKLVEDQSPKVPTGSPGFDKASQATSQKPATKDSSQAPYERDFNQYFRDTQSLLPRPIGANAEAIFKEFLKEKADKLKKKHELLY